MSGAGGASVAGAPAERAPGGGGAGAPPAKRERPWLGPIERVLGPVFEREVRVSGRRGGTYLVRGLYVLAMAGLLTLVAGPMVVEAVAASGAERVQALQSVAPTLAVTLAWFQLVGMLVVAPVLTAPALCDERRLRTLPALLTTPMTAFTIAWGALCGRAVQALILILSSVPVLLAARALGGVSAQFVIASSAITLSLALLGLCAGLFASVRARSAANAGASAVGTLVATQIMPFGALLLWSLWGGMAGGPPPALAFGMGVFGAMGTVTAEFLTGGAGVLASSAYAAQVCVAYNLALAVVFFVATVGLLRRSMLREGADAPAPTAKARRRGAKKAAAVGTSADASAAGRLGATADATGDSRAGAPDSDARAAARDESGAVRASGVVGDRPVLWRELRRPLFRRRWHPWAIAACVVFGGGWLAWRVGYADTYDPEALRGVGAMALMMGLAISVLIAAAASTALIAQERDARTLDDLLSTRVTPREIIVAKLLGALARQWVVPGVALAYALVVGVVIGGAPLMMLVYALMIVAPALVLLNASGLAAATWVRKASTAGVLNLLGAIGLWGLLPAVGGILAGVWRMPETVLDPVLAINPFANMIFAVIGSIDRQEGYHFATHEVGPVEFLLLLGVVGLVQLAGAAAMVWVAANGVRRMTSR